MSRISAVDDVSSINTDKNNWNVVVKVVRLWLGQSYGYSKLPFTMDMVLVDSKGCKIQACVKKTLLYRFEPKISEGNVYALSGFIVAENEGDYRYTRHPFKLHFCMCTNVKLLKESVIEVNPFSFIPFPELVSDDYDRAYLCDAIGLVTGVGTERAIENPRNKTKVINVELESDGVKVELSLFGNFVDELKAFMDSHGSTTSTVLAIQYAKVKNFNGKVGIHNVHGASKLFFNPNIPEAVTLNQSFLSQNDSGSMVLSQLGESSRVSAEEDFLSSTQRKTLEEVRACTEESTCVVMAVITGITDDDWWYRACKCSRKMIIDEEQYFCENCNRHYHSFTPRYRLKVRVMDDDDTAVFVMFDNEASLLLGKSCREMREIAKKCDVVGGIPLEMLGILDKKCLFKIDVKPASKCLYDNSYRVKRVSMEPDLIGIFETPMKALTYGGDDTDGFMTPTSNVKPSSEYESLTKALVDDFKDSPAAGVGQGSSAMMEDSDELPLAQMCAKRVYSLSSEDAMESGTKVKAKNIKIKKEKK